MKETTNHKIRYPEPKDPDTLAAYWENQAKDVERELDAIDPKQIVGGSAGKLLIAKSTGAGAYTAMKGDATLAEDGTVTIANDAINAAKIAENAVGSSEIAAGAAGESELADKAVTSRKTKLSSGVVTASENLSLSGSYADVAGASLAITPVIASTLYIVSVVNFSAGSAAWEGVATFKVDSEAELSPLSGAKLTNSGDYQQVPQVYAIPLTAAAHTIKMRAKRTAGTGGFIVASSNTQFLWLLMAS